MDYLQFKSIPWDKYRRNNTCSQHLSEVVFQNIEKIITQGFMSYPGYY